MRSNRNVGASDSDEAVPLLTDIAVPGSSVVSHRSSATKLPVLTNAVTTIPEPASGAPRQSEPRAQFSATRCRTARSSPDRRCPKRRSRVPAATEHETEPVFSVTAMRAQLAETENWDAELIVRRPGPDWPAAGFRRGCPERRGNRGDRLLPGSPESRPVYRACIAGASHHASVAHPRAREQRVAGNIARQPRCADSAVRRRGDRKAAGRSPRFKQVTPFPRSGANSVGYNSML